MTPTRRPPGPTGWRRRCRHAIGSAWAFDRVDGPVASATASGER